MNRNVCQISKFILHLQQPLRASPQVPRVVSLLVIAGYFWTTARRVTSPFWGSHFYANRKGAPLENCFGFVDGTVRPICRPNENQSTVYNGHKRVHALKFQSVTIPTGLIANLYGPVGIKVVTCIYLLIFFHEIYHRVVLCTKLFALLEALKN